MISPIETLKQAIAEFGARNPQSIRVYDKGHRVIVEGEEGTDFFLVQQGYLGILVQSPTGGKEQEVALRYEGDLIGESAILQRRGRRNASVEVVSSKATLVCLSRRDVLALIRGDVTLSEAIIAIWELAATRRSETLQVIDGLIRVTNKVMSVIIADIHNFSALGEEILDEIQNAFLFEFMDECEAISSSFEGLFEDQGDGFKVIFEDINHVGRAVSCAASLQQIFIKLRQKWASRAEAFHSIGLGIGVCTDCMSIQQKIDSARRRVRIASHAINIAAAMAKYHGAPSDVEAYLDENAASMLRSNQFMVENGQEKWLDRLGRRQTLHRLVTEPYVEDTRLMQRELSKATPDAINKITILFVASDPSNEARLRLGEESREIHEKIQLSRYRDRFRIEQHHALRASDLSQALLDLEPQIVHFAGHGAGDQGLCFEGRDGTSQMVSSAALSALFKEFSRSVKCVILNACYSEIQANGIVRHIDYVIGMNNAIGDAAAIAFAVGFYQALGAARSFEDAFQLGCALVDTTGNNQSHIPVIKIRGSNTRAIVSTPGEPPRVE
jgi:CRP-like cAMP-binding protein